MTLVALAKTAFVLQPRSRMAAITHEAMDQPLGRHLKVNRCAYAEVDDDHETVHLSGDHADGVTTRWYRR